MMGGAPQGPAGTGKTETTKDLGRGLAIWVIVQNCSDQMTNKVTGNFFSGLAQTGAWGCFDEFNRITVEVLSVVATQYGSILEAIRARKHQFIFEEETINCVWSIGAWITMNPGYAGRAELPENLKALFRPCAMVVPDFENIAEINLAAEGFVESKILAHKFVELFYMSKELLSKQHHYDWGLRAMTGVLRIAGGMKRASPDQSEYQILMRAMRDTNLPKFVAADFGIFLGLINDLFPRVESPPVKNKELEDAIKQVIASEESKLQPEENFVVKVTNLSEMLGVRHCVFVLGCAGSAKTELWKNLADAQTVLKVGGGRTTYSTLNPKAVTSNDLYGYVHPVTKEPYDGIIAKIMREYSAKQDDLPKWIILDGDIDAEWIESMNTVMDDNKVLTLVSNERIPLAAPMRLIFEISHLRNASPATVSRAGVIFLNEYDVGWRPYVQTWVESMGDAKVQTILEQLFDQFVQPTLDMIRKEKWSHVTPIKDFAMVQVICRILEGVLNPESCPPNAENPKDIYEAYFQFAAVWAIGGAFGSDKGADFRKQFDSYWRTEFSKVQLKFPDEGSIYDYFIDPNTKKGEPKRWIQWREIIPEYTHDRTLTYARIMVPTLDTTRTNYLAEMMLALKKPVMLVGNSGSAKTVILSSLLRGLDDEKWMFYNISFNSFTIASDLQFMLEAPLEKKTGSIFGPPGTKRLVYFIDDFNMPTPDKYGTQSAIALLRQNYDNGGFYDLKKLGMKRLENVQYVGAMNPTAGSFYIIDRMQRHFLTMATPFPEAQVLSHIYVNIFGGHIAALFKNQEITDALLPLVNCGVGVHCAVADSFLPTAVKFHYQWNLRALAAVFQGMVSTSPVTVKTPLDMARLLIHEINRVYGDRMVSEQDVERFQEVIQKQCKNHLGDINQDELAAEPNLWGTFVEEPEGDFKLYLPLKGLDHLSGILEKQLFLYNETFAVMNLVLFNQAMEHVCRISRIIDSPRGNAMLVGVGGSGKQSLTRLAAFIGGCEVFQIKITASYNMNEFKEDLRSVFMKTGIKSIPTVFLFTDQQIFKESSLIYLNDILSLGCPPDLFNEEDKDTIINGVRGEAKAAGVLDSRDTLFEFYVEKVRALLHIVCCMSPVGDKFRNRCRKFPALTNCTAINWFFGWPEQALISVANRFLADVEMESDELRKQCADHMAFVHTSVGTSAEQYRKTDRREVYTTPKSYLELIDLYKVQLAKNRNEIDVLKTRLSDGLIKLRDAESQVADMQIKLKDESVVVEAKKKETDELLVVVGQESLVAEEEAAKAAIEEEAVAVQAAEVTAFQESANKDLAAAEPAILKAEAALNGLNKAALGELKGLATPPAAVLNVTAAVSYMLAPKGANLKKIDITWGGAKKMMGAVDQFLSTLQTFDKDNFDLAAKAEVRKYTGPADAPNPEFNFDYMKTKSQAAAGLCDWIVNICIYHDIYLDVAPKRVKLKEAEGQLAEANKKLTAVRAHVANLEARKAELQAQLEEATNEKNDLVAKAESTAKRLNLAQRLVDGLKDEGIRWTASVESLDEKYRLLVGDVMLSSSFIAYIAPFSRGIRDILVSEKWSPDLVSRNIPMTANLDPMDLLTNMATTAGWRTEGLPADPLSTQNAAIITRCARFPLIIDPQLQAVAWIGQREEPNGLIRLTLGSKGYLDKVIRSLEEGLPLLIEKMGESIDAVLDNVIARAFIKKGSKLQVKLGDRDTDVLCAKDEDGQPTSDPLFKIYMQTKLPNPHYIPEVQAQTTVVNFTVTERGLEDQLLSTVVGKERPDLLQEQSDLVKMQNGFIIQLKQLEDNLLYLLATAEGDILSNEELIITLEETKATVKDINEKAAIGKVKQEEIAKAFESYRPNANRGSLIYFLMNQLNVIDHMYQYSLAAFNFIFNKALDKAEAAETLKERVASLQESVTNTLFAFVTRGLFERHRLIFSTQLAIKVAFQTNEINAAELDMLIQAPKNNEKENPVAAWLSDASWGSVQALSVMEDFASLPADMEGSWKRWKEWCELEQPENQPLPQEWKRLGGFQQLLIMRALRPDRMTLAIRNWVVQVLGAAFGAAVNFNLPLSFEDSGPAVPIFFLLSPGVDATGEVRTLGRQLGFTEDAGKLTTVSLGQGQEPVAEKALDQMYHEGGWAMLENIELVANWLPKLEKVLESLEEGGDPAFRTFLSAMPQDVVPVPILQKSIKLTNEPPSGLKANLKRAYLNFTDVIWENSSKASEFKAIIFALCFFHSVCCERRKFGPMGWNRIYPFNPGDLKDSIAVGNNYLEAGGKIPWPDLRYLFGEIFYGGHITDGKDRILCSTFLEKYVKEELVEGIEMFAGFMSPPASNHAGYLEYIEETLERETPIAYGLHPNSEINFMTTEAANLFNAIADLSPKGGGGEGGMTLQEKVQQQLDDILDKLPDLFIMVEIEDRIDERTPYTGVFLQECERMNMLIFEMGRSLRELAAGLRGDLSITENMEALMGALFMGKVPATWEKLAWPSLAGLAGWLVNMLARQRQMADWTADLATPKCTWISGFFNPQSFITAVMQVTARKMEWPLDRLLPVVDVTKKQPEEIESSTRDGAYIHGMFMEGARWDIATGVIEDSFMKELYPVMPVVNLRAQLIDKADARDQFMCPIYKTQMRNNDFVVSVGLRTKQPASKWIMAGVALLMDVVEA
jgi:dynein heavy chain